MSSKRIGNNFVIDCFGTKHVLGGRESIVLFISMNIVLFVIVLGWILSINYYYHYSVYIIGVMLYCCTTYNAICCFITEPGIIPRSHPLFQVRESCNDQPQNTDPNIKDNSINSLLKEKIKDQGSSDSITNAIIPSIFTERNCSTCNIVRPPKASHCSYCDNCVLDFDHHCFFISNCVGARNHKYFLLVLFFGVLLMVYIAAFCIGHVVYVYITFNGPNIVSLLFKEYLALMIIATILIVVSLFCLCMGCHDYMSAGIPAGIGYAIVIVLFYISTAEQQQVYPYYYNPFSFVILVASIFLCAFAGVNLSRVLYNLFKGYTTKQLMSIQREYVKSSNEEKSEMDEGYLRSKTCREKMGNVFSLVFQNQIQSLIDPIRDLDTNIMNI